ncbi:MAG: isoprenyl transferase [Phycisphaerales bacterium]|nr:isoprenyl transferase [Phycisphaerales bacterium]
MPSNASTPTSQQRTEPAQDPLPDVPLERRPKHIAIIMDGNGRWALEHGKPRISGHRAGAPVTRDIIIAAGHLHIDTMTMYSFSIENWKRPPEEVSALMSLYLEYLAKERDELIRNNVRFQQIGRREGLDPAVLAAVDETIEATSHCTGLTLNLAVNYSSRQEITDAVTAIANKVASGKLDRDAITEQLVSDHLYTAGQPDPDLLIRTAGEHRISNYLLWQISYAEIHVTDTYWPDFCDEDLHKAIRDYASRDRRFGGVDKTNS